METHAILAFGPPDPATPVVCLQWHSGGPGLGTFLQQARERHVGYRRGDRASATVARDAFAAITRVLLASGTVSKGVLAHVDPGAFEHRLYVLDERLDIVACEDYDVTAVPRVLASR